MAFREQNEARAMDLTITSDLTEKIRFAKAILEEKRDYYTDEKLQELRNTICEYVGNTTISDTDIELILLKTVYYYWAYGCSVVEFFEFELGEKSPKQIKEYVTIKEKVIYTNRLNNISDAHILQNKYETFEMFKKYYKRDLILCDGKDSLETFLSFVKKHPVFVVKPLKLGGGEGIRKESVVGLSEEEIFAKFHNLLSGYESLNARLNSWGGVNAFVAEELVEQAEEMAVLHPQSVNGIRVPTLNIGGNIIIYQPWLKAGVGNSFTDNLHTGGFKAGIDLKTGIVDTVGFSTKLEKYEYHPDTKIKIPGFQIPEWSSLITIVKEISSKLPTIRYIGWDMVYTTKGWAIMEGNFRGNFGWQTFRQKGMKAEFEELTGIHLEDKFWWE